MEIVGSTNVHAPYSIVFKGPSTLDKFQISTCTISFYFLKHHFPPHSFTEFTILKYNNDFVKIIIIYLNNIPFDMHCLPLGSCSQLLQLLVYMKLA